MREEARPQPARDRRPGVVGAAHPAAARPADAAHHSATADSHASTRLWHWLDPETRDALFSRAQARGVTPAMTLAAAFANALARWSTTSRFLLNVPLFGRQPLHPDVDSLVGDFTSSLLLDVDLTGTRTPAGRARGRAGGDADRRRPFRLSRAVRAAGPQPPPRHPGAGAGGLHQCAGTRANCSAAEVTDQFGTPAWIISQGPQVLLDAQVTEFDGGVLVNWDVREGVFAPGVIDAMFA